MTSTFFGAFFLVFAAAAPADRLALGNRFSKLGMYAEARAEYQAVKGNAAVPQDEVLYGIGDCENKLGRKAEAVEAFTAVVEKFPASKLADYARLNKALLSDGETREKELRRLDRPETPKAVRDMARFSLAPILSASADAAERRKALGIYLDLSASADAKVAEEATFFASMLSYREGNYVEAATLYATLQKRFPTGRRTVESRVYKAWSEHLAGRPAAALGTASAALAAGATADATEDFLYLKASSLRKLERRGEAASAYGELLAKFPDGRYADAAWRERLALRAADRDHAGVLADVEKRGDWPASGAARVFTYAYESAAATTNWAAAVRYARRAAAAGGDLAPRALYLAAAYEARLGQVREAMADWTALLAKYPDCPFAADALRARGMEEIRQQDHKAAHRTLGELARRYPDRAKDAETLYWRGVAARGAGDESEAEARFRETLAAKPDAETARDAKLELAFVLERKGAKTESAKLLAELLDTPAVDRMTPASLAWTAETLLEGDAAMAASAAKAAGLLERRDVDPTWKQIAATLRGRAEEKRGALDAAAAAYARALEQNARTPSAATAALNLGRLETSAADHDKARDHLTEAVERANTPELVELRVLAYAALAENEEKRGDREAALKYHLLVGTLFDHAVHTPKSLAAAAAILDESNRKKEADALRMELKTRYGK
ncbi:MAG: tetratricopeptide repeat protein [Kiritimatiellae bacterium]|nr:tetratricopeptide repeat protein [Kiritimatiellia bacterium]